MTQDQIHSLENEDVFGLTNKIGWSLIPRHLCTLVHDNVVKQLKAKCVPFRIQCCGSAANAQNIHDLQKVGQKESSISFPHINIVSWTTSTVSPSCSSGRFPRAHNTGSTPRSPRIDGERTRNSAVEISRTASSLCQCTTTLIGEEKATKKFVWKIHRALRILP